MNIDFYIPRAERRFDNWEYFEYAKKKSILSFLRFFVFVIEISFNLKLSFLQSK